MRKIVLLSGVASLAVFAACTPAPAGNTGTDVSSSAPAAMEQSSSSADAMVRPSDAATASSVPTAMEKSQPAAAKTVTIDMTVENFKFTPNVIRVKKGDKLVIRLTDTTGVHGIGIRDLNISVGIGMGETKDIVIPTDTAGTFDFRCNVPCGPGHKEMTGQIIIE